MTATRSSIARVARNFQQRFGLSQAACALGITVLSTLRVKEFPTFASLLLQAGFTHDAGSGIGIADARDRLAALFKHGATVSVGPPAAGSVAVTLVLPISA